MHRAGVSETLVTTSQVLLEASPTLPSAIAKTTPNSQTLDLLSGVDRNVWMKQLMATGYEGDILHQMNEDTVTVSELRALGLQVVWTFCSELPGS